MRTSRRRFLAVTAVGLSVRGLASSAVLDPLQRPSEASAGFTPPGLWDYFAHPVVVKDPKAPKSWYNVVEAAFDGYGGALHPNSVARCWTQPGLPSEREPFFCTIDYGAPAAISKFVHYFYTSSVRDYRTDPLLLSSAFQAVTIYRSDDGVRWRLAERYDYLPPDWPQALTLSRPASTRYYKIEITKLVPGAEGIRTYEIESITGPVIHNPRVVTEHVKAGEPLELSGRVVGINSGERYLVVVWPSGQVKQVDGPCAVEPDGNFRLRLATFQPGIVAAMLKLENGRGVTLDERSVTLRPAPRVLVQQVRVEAGSALGVALNNSTAAVAVEMRSGGRSVGLGNLPPGEAAQFRIPDASPGLVQVDVRENGKVQSRWNFVTRASASKGEGQLANDKLTVHWAVEEGHLHLALTPKGSRTIESGLELTYNSEPVVFTEAKVKPAKTILYAAQEHEALECTLELKNSALRAGFRMIVNGLEETRSPGVLSLRLKPQAVKFRFVPAYVYSKEPVSRFVGVYGDQNLVRGAWFAPTRMVGLETNDGSIGLVPDRDRCLMGVDLNDAVMTTRLGEKAVEVLVPIVAGDWFELFRYVVGYIYRFEEPRQYEPLTKCISDRLQYLTLNEDNWSNKMQVVTSFPRQDYVFVFYGLTYTIPALYSWYLASGDTRALERARKCVEWLVSYPGVRIKEGATEGAFFSQFISPELRIFRLGSFAIPEKGAGGCDQAHNRWLEPHATGAAAWTLLDYYIVDGKRDDNALAAARAGLDWLLKVQGEDGGWVYAYHVDGTRVTDQQDSGNIWNIWALFRYGKLTGKQRYLDAAERAKQWFGSKFIANHICRGYWEDVSGGGGRVELSWEAYEFAIATIAFAEMGDSDLAVAAARNAVTWIWTRTIACRRYSNSYGHVHEQWGWPPATYLAPMFGLAAQTAFRITGDDFFRQIAGTAKTIGWWTVRNTKNGIWPSEASKTDLGGSFWPLEATEFVPLEEPFLVTIWVDWVSSQQATICLTWLIHEANLRCGGKIQVDPTTLRGNILGEPGRVVLQPHQPGIRGGHQQIDWLGYRTARLSAVVLMNFAEATEVQVSVPSLRASKVTVLSTPDGKHWQESISNATSAFTASLPDHGTAIIRWQ